MRAARIALLIPSLLLATAASADEWPISTAASLGPVPSVGIGSTRFDAGFTFGLEAIWHPERATSWTLRSGRTDLSRALGDEPALQLLSSGQYYVPNAAEGATGSDIHFLQLGIRQSRVFSRVRPFLEASVGAGVVNDVASRVQGPSGPGRNRAWTAQDPYPPAPAGRENILAPFFGAGVGAVTTLPGRIALSASVGAEFAPVRDLVGAQLPVRFGAVWPAASSGAVQPAGPGAPRLRVAAGRSALHAPQRIEGGLGHGLSFAAELELPIRERLSISLAGEHDTREARETYYLPGVDSSSRVQYLPAGSVEASFSATVATLGVRVQQPIGRAWLSLRSGLGFGRTSGFGTTVESVQGAYLDANGFWVPVRELGTIGGGAAETGWAFALAAGAEARVAGAARVFAESGLTSIELAGDHVRMTPLRFGVALH